jgi:hypothetical protein
MFALLHCAERAMSKRGKTSSAPPPPPAPPSCDVVFEGGRRPRPPKGHRQRGAGSVQVDKGPVEKDGITIQSYQRLPTQLLQQWTDKQKRPKMQFRTVSPGGAGLHRLEVVLPDAKNSSKDLHYCPAESFAAAAQAKEFAALLALMDLQPTLPLERKLPEPYRCVSEYCVYIKLIVRYLLLVRQCLSITIYVCT